MKIEHEKLNLGTMNAAPFIASEKSTVPEQQKNSTVPFFRSLNPEILKLFLQNSSVISVPTGIVLCQQGSLERSLLVLLTVHTAIKV